MHQVETQNSLKGRINDYLRDKPREIAVEASEEEVAEAVYDMLKEAEEDLNAAKKRVDRLKWELLRINPQHT